MPTQQEGTVALYIRIPPKLKAWLADYAARLDVSMNDCVVAALEEHLEKHDPQGMRPRGK